MMKLHIQDETSQLVAVILGIGYSPGPEPKTDQAYDPKSLESIQKGIYPAEADLTEEMENFRNVLLKYNITVYRPRNLPGTNQVFARDIGIVIGNKYIVPNIVPERVHELEGVSYLVNQLPAQQILRAPEGVHLEGGDIMPWQGKIFAGYSEDEDFNNYKVARTNRAGVEYLQKNFPDWEVIPVQLMKSDTDPRQNALHLDCCFQPVGTRNAIIFREGFKNASDLEKIFTQFPQENCFFTDREEMYQMNPNVFSVNPETVVSDSSFSRLNTWLEGLGITVELVKYREVSKMGGLLRCSTMPLRRR